MTQAWISPKLDWTSVDGVSDTDLKRIEGNTQYLKENQGSSNIFSSLNLLRNSRDNTKTIKIGLHSDWVGAGALAGQYVIFPFGDALPNALLRLASAGIYLYQNNATADLLTATKNNVTIDLSVFESNIASDTGDYIIIPFFPYNNETLINNLWIAFGSDVTFNAANSLKYTMSTGIVGNQLNFIVAKKSDFVTAGTGAWNSIKSIQFGWSTKVNANGKYILFDSIYMCRKDPVDSAKFFPFQNKSTGSWARDIEWDGRGYWYVGYESNELMAKELKGDASISLTQLKFLSQTTGDYDILYTFRDPGMNGRGNALMHYVDDNNYYYVEMKVSVLRIIQRVAGGSETTMLTTSLNTLSNPSPMKHIMRLSRRGQQLSVSVFKTAEDAPLVSVSVSGLTQTTGYIAIQNTGVSGLRSEIYDIEVANGINSSDILTAGKAKGQNPGRGASLVIAPSNATALSKAQADIVCDGTSDANQIQQAITIWLKSPYYSERFVRHSGTLVAASASGATLSVLASSADEDYTGGFITITSGTGSGQQRFIQNYDGLTRKVTTYGVWSPQPDNTSKYEIQTSAGKVLLLEGDFYFGDQGSNIAQMLNGLTLEGCGDGTTIHYNGDGYYNGAFYASTNSYVGNTVFRNFRIIGNYMERLPTVTNMGFYYPNAQSCVWENVTVENFRVGINLQGRGHVIRGCKFINCSQAIYIYGNQCLIDGNRVYGNYSTQMNTGISIASNSDQYYGVEGSIITNNIVKGMSHGIYPTGIGHVISDNVCSNNLYYGIYLCACRDCIITSNIVIENGQIGIALYTWVTECLISNNLVMGNGITTHNTYANIGYESGTYGLIRNTFINNKVRKGLIIYEAPCNDTGSVSQLTLYNDTSYKSPTDGAYVNKYVEITKGTGVGGLRKITAYTASTGKITLDSNITVDATSYICIYNGLGLSAYGIRMGGIDNIVTNNDNRSSGVTGNLADNGTGTITTAGNQN